MHGLRLRQRTARGMSVVATFFVIGCGSQDAAPQQTRTGIETVSPPTPTAVAFQATTGYVITAQDSITLELEVAESADQRAFGLMDRDQLDSDAGMIFLYDEQQPGSSGFWMYRTRIPLDIAFLDGAGRIVAIRTMEPCTSPDPTTCMNLAREYNPGQPYFGALEVNAGYFADHGVVVGDRVVVPGRIGA